MATMTTMMMSWQASSLLLLLCRRVSEGKCKSRMWAGKGEDVAEQGPEHMTATMTAMAMHDCVIVIVIIVSQCRHK